MLDREVVMKRLYYLGKPGDGYGWGIANTNLVRELNKLCECIVDTSECVSFDAPVFVPVADSHLNPIRRVKAPRVIGYCFTEWPITPEAQRNSELYDVLFSGSNWNVQRLAEKGIKSEVLHQGVDFERFTPQPASDRKGFVVFSGGKFEFRKGQDYVIAAMRVFMKEHVDAVLLCSWHNPWPESSQSMNKSWFIADLAKPFDGLPMERVLNLPSMTNEQLPNVYKLAHVGLFPNRCEAGTNLVMSEFMACARPVIATNATGHADVLSGPGPMILETGSTDPAGWFNTNIGDILYWLEWCYANRGDVLHERGLQCRQLIEPFIWEKCARTIYERAFGL